MSLVVRPSSRSARQAGRWARPIRLLALIGLASTLVVDAPITADAAPRAVPAASSSDPVALPWHLHRSGSLEGLPVDDGAIGLLVSSACTDGAPVYATEVASWAPPRTMTVVAEQVTVTQWARDTVAWWNGLAVLTPGGRVLGCLTGEGIQQTPRITLAKGRTVHLVQFMTEPGTSGADWSQDSVLLEAPSGSPSNDTPDDAKVITSLPVQLKVDNRFATSSPQDWQSDEGHDCSVAWIQARPGLSRSAWYRYTPTADETVWLRGSAATGVPVIAEQTTEGLRWLPGSCAADRFSPTLDTLAAGHTYLIEVGAAYDGLDTTLADAIRPTTVVVKRVAPSRRGLSIAMDPAPAEGDLASGWVTCPAGRTFTVHGRATTTATPRFVVLAFQEAGTCTGRPQAWRSENTTYYTDISEALAVVVVTTPTGATSLIGPATASFG